MNSIDSKVDPLLNIWPSDNPYTDRHELIKAIDQKQKKWFTFSWYVQDIQWYGDTSRYLQIAQYVWEGNKANKRPLFEILGPGTAVHAPHMILEISKRNADGTLPKTEQEAENLNPSMIINYNGKMYIIPLNQAIEDRDRHKILEKNYNSIGEKLKELDSDTLKNNKVVTDTVIQTLQQNNSLKAPLEKSLTPIEKLKKRLWDLLRLSIKKSKPNDTSETHKAA